MTVLQKARLCPKPILPIVIVLLAGVTPLDAECRLLCCCFDLVSLFAVKENLMQNTRDRPERALGQFDAGL